MSGALLVLAPLGLLTESAEAAPALRTQVVQHGDFVLIGNPLAQDCSLNADPATTLLSGTLGACPAGTTGLQGNGPDVFWTTDGTTANASTAVTLANASSLAVLSIPAGATVTHAYLYWSGRPSQSGGNGSAANLPDTGVVLDRPGVGAFTANLTAVAPNIWSTPGPGLGVPNMPFPPNYPGYQAMVDVTQIVQQNGSGKYRVSGVDSMNFASTLPVSNTGVGWWMVVLYKDITQPTRAISVFDGFDFVNTAQPFTVTLSGFAIPPSGATGTLGVVAMAGDTAATGDALLFNGVALSDALNPADNFFNGTRSHLGKAVSDPTAAVSNVGDLPRLSGTPGSMSEMDIDVVDVTARVSPGDTSALIQAGNMGDVGWINTFITSVTTLAPDFITSTKTVTNVTSGAFPAHPGDVLQYTITATNVGNDSAVAAVLADVLPSTVTFVPGSIQITTGPNMGMKTGASGDDQGDYIAATTTVRVRLGAGAGAVAGGALGQGETTTVTFQVQINTGATGIIANQAVITAAGLLGTPAVDYPTDGNGNAAGTPPTTTISTCTADGQCAGPTSGVVCDVAGTAACVPGCRGMGGNGCPAGLVCTSTTTAIGQCPPVGGCNADADCSGGKWCNLSTHVCTDKLPNGTTIPTDGPHTGPTLNGLCTQAAAVLVCASGVCDVADNKCGFLNGDGPCNVANGGVVCRSGVCSPNSTLCIPAGGCAIDKDCASNQWCDASTLTCKPKVPNGGAVPTSPGHGPPLTGTCTQPAASATCVSGVCDTGDNLCGFANGKGPCDMTTGPVVCRSMLCSANGVCIPPNSCNVDADCPTTDWCNISVHTCTTKLGNGTPIPMDPPHMGPTLDGNCTPAAAMVVCQSGVCDPIDDQCGFANGNGPCSATSGATVCRSGICAIAGPNVNLCVACVMDGQCPATNTCDTTTNACIDGCANDADCGGPMSAKVCDGTTHMCVDGCRGMNGNGCPTGQVCTSTGSIIGMCMECTMDADCGGPTSARVCDTNNTCVDGCRGQLGNGCKPGDKCSSMDGTLGTCMPASSTSASTSTSASSSGDPGTGGAGSGSGGSGGSGGGESTNFYACSANPARGAAGGGSPVPCALFALAFAHVCRRRRGASGMASATSTRESPTMGPVSMTSRARRPSL